MVVVGMGVHSELFLVPLDVDIERRSIRLHLTAFISPPSSHRLHLTVELVAAAPAGHTSQFGHPKSCALSAVRFFEARIQSTRTPASFSMVRKNAAK